LHSEVFDTIFTQKQRADKSLIAMNKTLVAGLALLMFGFQLYGVEPINSDLVKAFQGPWIKTIQKTTN
jgi:hypothetical protein